MKIFKLSYCSSYDGICNTRDYFETYEKLLQYMKTEDSLKDEDIREHKDWYNEWLKNDNKDSFVYKIIEVK